MEKQPKGLERRGDTTPEVLERLRTIAMRIEELRGVRGEARVKTPQEEDELDALLLEQKSLEG